MKDCKTRQKKCNFRHESQFVNNKNHVPEVTFTEHTCFFCMGWS